MDSVVGIPIRYWLDGPGIESRWGTRFSVPVQTGHGTQPASYTKGTASFPWGKSAGAWCWSPTPIQLQGYRKNRAILEPPLCALVACSRAKLHLCIFGAKPCDSKCCLEFVTTVRINAVCWVLSSCSFTDRYHCFILEIWAADLFDLWKLTCYQRMFRQITVSKFWLLLRKDADWGQEILAIIRCRIFCLPRCYPKI